MARRRVKGRTQRISRISVRSFLSCHAQLFWRRDWVRDTTECLRDGFFPVAEAPTKCAGHISTSGERMRVIVVSYSLRCPSSRSSVRDCGASHALVHSEALIGRPRWIRKVKQPARWCVCTADNRLAILCRFLSPCMLDAMLSMNDGVPR